MSLNIYRKMGLVTLRHSTEPRKKCLIYIYECNALAAFVYEYTENRQRWQQLYSFFGDEQHMNGCIKNGVNIFDGKDVLKIELNMAFKDNKKVLDYFLHFGYHVDCYYEKQS